ncbi:MAG: tetratricopeptide repeat protein [Bryobacteraceae bacterium]
MMTARSKQPAAAAALCCLLLATGAYGQSSASTQPAAGFNTSITLFTALVAINAAGYNAGMNSPLNTRYPLRNEIRQELAQRKIPCLRELKAFYKAHKRASDTADLGQYISFALVAGGPPKFAVPAEGLPPDAQSLAGFSSLLARFYKEADVEKLWVQGQPSYLAAIADYQDPVINSIFEADGYLRNPSEAGRGFQIFIELMGAPDQVQVRSYHNDYYVVVTPSSKPAVDAIRNAYLAYTLDPLSYLYADEIDQKKALETVAQRAPALNLAYKDNFSLLVTQCLVKAIDSRLMHTGAQERQTFVDQAMRQGYILTAYFASMLPAYEKSQFAFRLFYPKLLESINVKKEEKKLRKIQFAKTAPARVVAPPATMQIDPVQKTLASAEGMFQQHNLQKSAKTFRQVLQQTKKPDMLARAEYGLGLIALEEKRWDEAERQFQLTLAQSPQSREGAWSHYYLGQLDLKSGNPDKAVKEFKLTLATKGVSAKAQDAAAYALKHNSSSSAGEQEP